MSFPKIRTLTPFIAAIAVGSIAAVGLAVVQQDDDRIEGIVEISGDTPFDASNLNALAGYSDDFAVVEIQGVESFSEVAFFTRYEVTVERSLRGLDYPNDRAFVGQLGGIFDLDGVKTRAVDESQDLLEVGDRYLVALRYADGQGYYSVLFGDHSVKADPSVGDINRYEAALRSAVVPVAVRDERDPLEQSVQQPLVPLGDFGMADSDQVASESDRRPNGSERAWSAQLDAACRQASSEWQTLVGVLSDARSAGEFDEKAASNAAHFSEALATLGLGKSPKLERNVRPAYTESWTLATTILAELPEQLEAVSATKGEDLHVAIEDTFTMIGQVELLLSEVGATQCSFQLPPPLGD